MTVSQYEKRKIHSAGLTLSYLRTKLVVATAIVLPTIALLASSHPRDASDGHIPANVNYGFEVIGRSSLDGVSDGLYTDVWSHNGYAYVGTFQEPDCTNSGVFVVDMMQAIDGYSAANESAGVVAEIKSAPNTRINDVKVHTVGGVDVLIATEEMCGKGIKGGAQSDASIGKGCPLQAGGGTGVCNRNNPNSNAQGADFQQGNGGISLYDVTDPTKPTPLEKNFYDVRGVHNTFAWSTDEGSYLIGVGGTEQFYDTFIMDISNPKKPELLVQTGVFDWLDDFSFAQVETGTFGSISLHDVWVEDINGVPTAVLSYWDGGFITLDLSDPANPVFLGDSNYPEPDPLLGKYEGNAHAAVFGGENGEYIFAGDEDFDAFEQAIDFNGENYPAGIALFGPTDVAIVGDIVWTNTEGCMAADVPTATAAGQIALIQRGTCFFQDKADSAEVQGYAGYIVANDADRGDATINMGARDDAPVGIPGAFVGYSTGELMKAGGTTVGLVQDFNGWGYLHVLDTDSLTHVGYYAPAETVEEEFAIGFGDLTMHNIEADPRTAGIIPSFNEGPRMFVSWYSLGMRAVEYRPGHFHDNSNGEGSYSENVHEVGRYIAPDGSNFWGVHVDELNGEQVIVASDRNTGLFIFTFSCETRLDDGTSVFYCDPDAGTPGPEDT